MAASLDETGAEKVLLVGHSAGGWLARAALAEGKWEEGVASEDVVAGKAVSNTFTRPFVEHVNFRGAALDMSRRKTEQPESQITGIRRQVQA